MTLPATLLLLSGAFAVLTPQAVPADHTRLIRRYREGETLTYHMKGVNEGRRYEAQANGVVKKDSAGRYFEEYAWSNLSAGGGAVALPPESVKFRQLLSLAPNYAPAVPNLSQVHPMLIGPITDLLTFYSDLWLAIRTGVFTRARDHLYKKHGTPASWADGAYVLIGEDSIDFDITLADINESGKVATLTVRHVPPQQPQVRLPAGWMREPVADTPNNWVEVAKKDGKYIAAVGKETFDVQMKVSLADGRVLSGSIDNPVQTVERECADAALTSCAGPRPHQLRRQIEITLER